MSIKSVFKLFLICASKTLSTIIVTVICGAIMTIYFADAVSSTGFITIIYRGKDHFLSDFEVLFVGFTCGFLACYLLIVFNVKKTFKDLIFSIKTDCILKKYMKLRANS